MSVAHAPAALARRTLTATRPLAEVDDASAPDYGGSPRARRVYLAACSSADGQQFRHESGATTDGNSLKSGPLQGVDGVVLGAKGNSDVDDTEIIGFSWQGGSNAYWSFDASAGSSSFLSTFGGEHGEGRASERLRAAEADPAANSRRPPSRRAGYCLSFCAKI